MCTKCRCEVAWKLSAWKIQLLGDFVYNVSFFSQLGPRENHETINLGILYIYEMQSSVRKRESVSQVQILAIVAYVHLAIMTKRKSMNRLSLNMYWINIWNSPTVLGMKNRIRKSSSNSGWGCLCSLSATVLGKGIKWPFPGFQIYILNWFVR